MTVIVLSSVPPGLRGELSKWMVEVSAGVYVGTVSAAVRERLWARIHRYSRTGTATMVQSTNTEQGYVMENLGDPSYRVRDFDGLQLVTRQPRQME
jgi:CRISPR-associated protein Cas2